MRNPFSSIRFRVSTGHTLVVAVLAPPCIMMFLHMRYWWVGIALVALGVIVATVTLSLIHI